ncbi:hypothetical protein [Desulfobacula sp.]|uniref:hypothetical protein n=1 Tax=Desulfobacula sp. TaxID=2593537 RepID=UPI0039B85035
MTFIKAYCSIYSFFIGVSFYFFTTALENKTISSLKRIAEDHRDMIKSFLMETGHASLSFSERRLLVKSSGQVAGMIREQDLFFEMEKILNS